MLTLDVYLRGIAQHQHSAILSSNLPKPLSEIQEDHNNGKGLILICEIIISTSVDQTPRMA